MLRSLSDPSLRLNLTGRREPDSVGAQIRGLTTGLMGLEQVWDFAYLVGFFSLAMVIAMRRMERKLIK